MELAATVANHLRQHDIQVVLVGGLSVEIYSENIYLTKDIDMVDISYRKPAQLHKAMAAIGFEKTGRVFSNKTTDITGGLPRVAEPEAFFKASGRALFDHGQFDYLVAAHLVKTWTAAHQGWETAPDAPWNDDLHAALNRFMHTPLKRKHVLRTARQSRRFVKLEG